jgi:serine/threonine-protein phosphatase 2A regulatory subunit A
MASLYDDSETRPLQLLVDELKSDDAQLRLNAIHRVSTIALALGPQRAREELVPFLQDSIDDEDEVLLALADELGKSFEDYIGGKEYAHLLLGPLEGLSAVEETLVRDKVCISPCLTIPLCSIPWFSPKATESITKVAAVLSPAQVEEFYIPLLKRLSQGEWFTSRTSSSSLYAPVYEAASEPTKEDMRKAFTVLGSDDTPMVRRAAAKWLGVRAFNSPFRISQSDASTALHKETSQKPCFNLCAACIP